MTFKKYIFWEPVVSPHKEDLFEAFGSTREDARVICVAHEGLPEERSRQGWSVKIPKSYELVIAPSDIEISDLINGGTDVLHIFSGVRHVPTIVTALRLVKRKCAPFGIMSEPRASEGWRGCLRYLHSWFTEGWLRRNAAFVLAIGINGPLWYQSVGYSKNRIFSFAYFVDGKDEFNALKNRKKNKVITIGFVGRLSKLKGVDDLISALAICCSAKLIVVGAGDLDSELKIRSKSLKLDVEFLGVKPIFEIPALMELMDVLVLPSIASDGWGVVVSEALLAGTAVIATSRVGASLVLDDKVLGIKVDTKSPKQIAAAIEELNRLDLYTPYSRWKRKKRAKEILTGAAGASYLVEIINYCFSGGNRPTLFGVNDIYDL